MSERPTKRSSTAPKPELALRALVGSLPSGLQAHPSELHATLCELLLALTRRRLRDEISGCSATSNAELSKLRGERQADLAWTELLSFAGRAPQDFPIPSLAAPAVTTVVDALFFGGDQPIAYTDFGIEQLGAVYEELLAFQLIRADEPYVCLKPSRAWISLPELSSVSPGQRGKWLQQRARLGKRWLLRNSEALAQAESQDAFMAALRELLPPKDHLADSGRWLVQPGLLRRRTGSHYTPGELCALVVRRALEPILTATTTSAQLLELRICDPAMGCGVFLLEACRQLGARLFELWQSEGQHQTDLSAALNAVATRCLYGVDINATAVRVARLSLEVVGRVTDDQALTTHLRAGDALVGIDPHHPLEWCGERAERFAAADEHIARLFEPKAPTRPAKSTQTSANTRQLPRGTFHWPLEFGEVFERSNPGFDACLGNPPWIAFVGRAAQPIEAGLANYYMRSFAGFRRYKTTHGLFASRAARLLRQGGRLGLVLPTSIADLDGYQPSRSAHDELCVPDAPLPDFGDGAFSGVFQPCMALLSTRNRSAPGPSLGRAWQLERSDLNNLELGLLQRLDELAKLPPELFGERGFQTTGSDLHHFKRARVPSEPVDTTTQAVHEGGDVSEFELSEPHLFVDPKKLNGRFRPANHWRGVSLFIRQTARYPIAQISDGEAFRNSLLAAFAHQNFNQHLILGYLNSSLARWFHYHRHRDARQGMPQLKIGHLRALPAIPTSTGGAAQKLERLAEGLARRNSGVSRAERCELDRFVFEAFGLPKAEQDAITRWAAACPPPKRRARSATAGQS